MTQKSHHQSGYLYNEVNIRNASHTITLLFCITYTPTFLQNWFFYMWKKKYVCVQLMLINYFFFKFKLGEIGQYCYLPFSITCCQGKFRYFLSGVDALQFTFTRYTLKITLYQYIGLYYATLITSPQNRISYWRTCSVLVLIKHTYLCD